MKEDDSVCELVGKHGMKSWSFIARQLKGRLGKQCRERWYNHLNPDINRAPWSAEEDAMIVEVTIISVIATNINRYDSNIETIAPIGESTPFI